MATSNRSFVPVLLASLLGAATGSLAPQTAAAQRPADSVTAGTVAATTTGTLAPSAAPAVATRRGAGPGSAVDRASEPVVFAGQASVSGRVISDNTFGAPPVLEIIVDLSSVTANGLRSGLAYEVQKEAIVRRPLQAFEQVEVGISFAPQGNVLQARSAVASFAVHYSAARGITTTPVKIVPHPPS